jgi:hypothetical protein
MVSVRAATPQDFVAMGVALRKTSRAQAIEHNGQIAALVGHYLNEGSVVIFANISPAARRIPGFARYALRFARDIIAEAAEYNLQVLAGADPEIKNADRLLEHLGFRHELGGTYSWHGHQSH